MDIHMRPARPVHVFPEIELECWSIFEAMVGSTTSLYLMGVNARSGRGRVSSAIKIIDVNRRIVDTASGRKYHLEGPSASHESAQAVFDAWALEYHVKTVRDVTAIYFPDEPQSV